MHAGCSVKEFPSNPALQRTAAPPAELVRWPFLGATVRRQISADELATLYHDIGACIWQMQYLEDVLHTFLTMKVELKEPGKVPAEEAMALLAKHRRATLGTSIRTAETNNALPQELVHQLRLLKEERDWLVHRSMHQDGENLYTDSGRNAIFTRLSVLQDEISHLKAEIMNQVESFCSGHGLSSAQASSLAAKQITALRGEG